MALKSRELYIVSYYFYSICLAGILALSACGTTAPKASALDVAARLQSLLGADAILLGEQHDNPDHQRIHREVLATLAAQGRLAALVIEMAAQGASTAALAPSASEAEVKAALNWDDKAWHWAAYAPVVMQAVRAGVAVTGGNLPRAQMREAMANAALDARLDAAALKNQRQQIREGHCDQLPESQIAPMTRIQIARDVAMAQAISGEVSKANAGLSAVAAQRRLIVVFIAGSGHVDAALGVPRHLAANVRARSVLLSATAAQAGSGSESGGSFDAVWPTASIEPKDYCAQLKERVGG